MKTKTPMKNPMPVRGQRTETHQAKFPSAPTIKKPPKLPKLVKPKVKK